jgi:hypothetical protein
MDIRSFQVPVIPNTATLTFLRQTSSSCSYLTSDGNLFFASSGKDGIGGIGEFFNPMTVLLVNFPVGVAMFLQPAGMVALHNGYDESNTGAS